jgi:diguanylate cyclase (GGDEF)-like protein
MKYQELGASDDAANPGPSTGDTAAEPDEIAEPPRPNQVAEPPRLNKVAEPPRPNKGDEARANKGTVALVDALFDGSDEVVIVIGRQREVRARAGAKALESMTGYSFEELLDDPLSVVRDSDERRVREAFELVLRSPGRRSAMSFWVHHRSGRLAQVKASAVNRVGDDVIDGVLLRFRELEASSSIQPPPMPEPPESQRDAGLVTREQFTDAVQWAVDRKDKKIWSAARHARAVVRDRRYDYTVVLVELDRFKMLVGGFGHQVADSVVAQVADRLGTVVRGRDCYAHLGGGEFGILLDAVGDSAHATEVSDRIQKAFQDRFDVGGHALAVSPIMGLATSQRRYTSAQDVMRDAAAAASHAPARGRGRRRAAFDSQMRVEDQHLMELIVALSEGLDQKQFHVHYQPIISLKTGMLTGFEALARWTHPKMGDVPPSEFIPVAEESGAICELGKYVMRQACEQAATWNAVYDPERPLSVSVNVSAQQLADESFLRDVEIVLVETGLPPEQLRLELTESAVLTNLDVTVGAMARLRLYGVTFSLDDFGTGYSSLSYLHKLNYDEIKIDRSFLSGGGLKNRIVVGAIVNLAHSLDMEAVAEGVETEEQREELLRIGCDNAQGYLYAKPMAAEQAAQLVEEQVAAAIEEPE